MKSKFPLGWILAVAALIIMAGLGFMSSYYTSGGKLAGGIIVAVCLLVVPIVLTLLLIRLKGCTKPFFFRNYAFKELGVLTLMLVGCIISMGLVDQFFAVNSCAKNIGNIMDNMDSTMTAMTTDYENHAIRRRDKYVLNLETVVKRRKGSERLAAYVDTILGTDTNTYAKKISTKGKTFYATIMIDSVSASVNPSKASVFKNTKWWNLPVLMNNADRVSDTLQREYNKLKKRSDNARADYNLLDKMNEYSLLTDAERKTAQDNLRWQYDPGDAVNIKHFFDDRNGFITSIWSVLVALAVFALALLPYMAAPNRDPRSKGLLEIFRKPTSYM